MRSLWRPTRKVGQTHPPKMFQAFSISGGIDSPLCKSLAVNISHWIPSCSWKQMADRPSIVACSHILLRQ